MYSRHLLLVLLSASLLPITCNAQATETVAATCLAAFNQSPAGQSCYKSSANYFYSQNGDTTCVIQTYCSDEGVENASGAINYISGLTLGEMSQGDFNFANTPVSGGK